MNAAPLLPLLVAFLGCSSPSPSATTAQPSPTGTGPSLNVPTESCPEAGSLTPVDAGACVVVTPRSFTRDIVPLFDGCTGEICHDFSAGAIKYQVGVLADECCNQISIIDPGHPERSYVVDKLSGKNLCMDSRQMPLGGAAFTAGEIQTVADWICQGASTSP